MGIEVDVPEYAFTPDELTDYRKALDETEKKRYIGVLTMIGTIERGKIEATAEQSTDMRWQKDARCLGVDPDLFFPQRGASTREAKEVCKQCSVKSECLEYSLQNGERFGIWGGLSERERRRLRSQRAAEARKTKKIN